MILSKTLIIVSEFARLDSASDEEGKISGYTRLIEDAEDSSEG